MCSTLPVHTESLACIEMPEAEPMDRYSHAIELSNACREFYQSRVETAASLKQRWRSDSNANTSRTHTNRIDQAMEKLRQEMASLMDQDLSLMKQLLTLNEEIEQLKWRRRYCWSQASVCSSSGDVRGTKEFSDSDMSLCQDVSSSSSFLSKSASASPCPLGPASGETHFPFFGEKERESSFDSGIHEACSEPLRPVLVTHL